MQFVRRLQDHEQEKFFQIMVILIIVFGIVLRVSKYLPAFLLRGDELAVTLNLVSRSPVELMTRPLDYEQAAPFGFLLLIKAFITLFGPSEYVLRLVAFLAGCLSLFLMQRLLAKTGGTYGILFGLIGFTFGNYLIYYSSELKQYSTDVLWTLILFLVFHRHISKPTAGKDFVLLAVVGALAVCFSYPAVFVIAGIGVTLFLHYWREKQKLLWLTLIGLLWLGIFSAIYIALLRHQTQDTYLITFWDNLLSFMPMPPWRDISWFPKALSGLFFVVAGLSSSLIVVIPIFIFGLWAFLKEKNWQWVLALTIPIAANVLVSGFQKYPFHGRLILYLLPLIFVVLGKGLDFLMGLLPNRALRLVAFAAFCVVMLRPVVTTTESYLVTRSYLQEDLKTVFSFLEENSQQDDIVYLYHFVGPVYHYYAPRYHLEHLSYVMGQNHSSRAKNYQDELSALPRGKRIWFVYSFVITTRVRKGERQDEREYMLAYLRENGTLLQEFYSTNDLSSAHLFILK